MSEKSIDEIILIDKETGWTCNDILSVLKRKLNPQKINPKFKIGHAGTLDPFATGLILVMLNKATKKFDELQTFKKEYIAEIEFGKKTDTYDITGEVVFDWSERNNKKVDLNIFDKKYFEQKLQKYLGKIKQIPPIYSALKINGVRAYDLARKSKIENQGEEMKKKEREVEVYEIEVLDISKNILRVRYVVSSGTYIRSLAYDLGEDLGFGAHLKRLQRTKIGNYLLVDAKKISDIF